MKKRILSLITILLLVITLSSCRKRVDLPKKQEDQLLKENVLADLNIDLKDAVSLGLREVKKDMPQQTSKDFKSALLINQTEETNRVVLAKKTINDDVVDVDFGITDEFEVIKLNVQKDFTYIMIAPRTESGYIEVEINLAANKDFTDSNNIYFGSENETYLMTFTTNRMKMGGNEWPDFDYYGYVNNEVYQTYIIDNETGNIYKPDVGMIQNIENNFVITADNKVVELTITENGLTTKSMQLYDDRYPREKGIFSDKYGNVFVENNTPFGNEEYIPVKRNDYVYYLKTEDEEVLEVTLSNYIFDSHDVDVKIYQENGTTRNVNKNDNIVAKLVFSSDVPKDPFNFVIIKKGYISHTFRTASGFRVIDLVGNDKTRNFEFRQLERPFYFISGLSRIISGTMNSNNTINTLEYVNMIEIMDYIVNRPTEFGQLFDNNVYGDYYINYRNRNNSIPKALTNEINFTTKNLRINEDKWVLYNKDGEHQLTQDEKGNFEVKLIKAFNRIDDIIKDWEPLNRG